MFIFNVEAKEKWTVLTALSAVESGTEKFDEELLKFFKKNDHQDFLNRQVFFDFLKQAEIKAQNNQTQLYPEICYHIGRFFLNHEKNQEAYYYFYRTLKTEKDLLDPAKPYIPNFHEDIAIIYFYFLRYANAESHLKKSLNHPLLNKEDRINVLNTNTGGNDFMFDDISFSPLCFEFDTIQITSVPKPVITVSPNDTICSGQSTQLTASSTMPNLVYNWTPGNISGQTITVSPTASTIYSVTGTSTFGCVSNIVSTAVLVRPSPELTWTISKDSICAGEPVQFNTTSNIPFTTFSYAPTAGIDGILIASPTETTTFTVTGTSPIGCTSTLSQSIYVIPATEVTITGELAFCQGSQTVLSGASNQPGTVLTWLPNGTTGSTLTVNDSNIGMIVLTGNYLNCPMGYDTVMTVFKENPIVFVPNDQIICAGESTTATVSSNQSGATFEWMPGNLTGATNVLQPNATTTYTVIATYDGCVSAPASFVLDLSGACSLEVPNVFTPNKDQVNDSFGLLSQSGITTLKCSIFNRWGNEIRTFDKPDFGWDGTDESNNQVTTGIYFYTIVATTSGGLTFNKQGFIHLIR